MKYKRRSVGQIVSAIKQHEAGRFTAEISQRGAFTLGSDVKACVAIFLGSKLRDRTYHASKLLFVKPLGD